MCKSGSDGQNAVTPERFLSAFIEEEICRLFSASRPLPRNGKKHADPAWAAASFARQQGNAPAGGRGRHAPALESLRKLVEHASSGGTSED
jgi:hypothetical protein